MDAVLTITFLRHGRSRADDEQVHEGHYDSPLTETGRAQAAARAQAFRAQGRSFDLVIASTLARARETAMIIGATLDIPVHADPDWQEMNSGPLAGMPFAEAAMRYPPPAFRGPFEPYHGTGESDWEVYRRAAKAVESVVRRGPGRYLVVAHGGILNAALRCIAGAGPFVNRQGLAYAFGDTGHATVAYEPARNLWLFREFAPG
jgi:2,3-bisphosphoglycerate-dependent phosphoglycerate mutase